MSVKEEIRSQFIGALSGAKFPIYSRKSSRTLYKLALTRATRQTTLR